MDVSTQIAVTANGRIFPVAKDCRLADFLRELGFSPGLVVVERNRQAVSPGECGEILLRDGDNLEIVKIVAGG